MLKTILASAVIMFAFAGAFAVISIIRAKFMGASAPHSCTEGCESCTNHCENYNVEEIAEEIRKSINK
ncbi:MAG: hypothetical protein Q4C80_05125 [Bacillota bacterium]|nr:hypothetical protein [Bacillota bacterium]